ncbi:testis-specific gene A8 protein-like [Cricetulus griseus]|uniref:Uncharacterized protein n=1 Tax=Cricetulus griseus TaxID=10029 RepID=G3IE20_CRIGR|nr:testis-specific gene A8 protein-like [Cricetulus griseus]EGW11754.1 hypothetical protein I79_021962 [Cricetulus griseus]
MDLSTSSMGIQAGARPMLPIKTKAAYKLYPASILSGKGNKRGKRALQKKSTKKDLKEVTPPVPAAEEEFTPLVPATEDVTPPVPVAEEFTPLVQAAKDDTPPVLEVEECTPPVPATKEVTPPAPVDEEVTPPVPAMEEVTPLVPASEEVTAPVLVKNGATPQGPMINRESPSISEEPQLLEELTEKSSEEEANAEASATGLEAAREGFGSHNDLGHKRWLHDETASLGGYMRREDLGLTWVKG